MITFFSEIILPGVVLFIVIAGLWKKLPLYELFRKGAADGLHTMAEICPVLIGLLIAVQVLRASGLLEQICVLLQPISLLFHLPVQVLPVAVIRLFSGSAATGLVLDIFRTTGPDSDAGMIASVMMSCTETVFYTMSIYYMSVKITKTRWTLPGALAATFAGMIASVLLVR